MNSASILTNSAIIARRKGKSSTDTPYIRQGGQKTSMSSNVRSFSCYRLSVSLDSAQLAEGLRQDRDDAIPLHYMRAPTPLEDGESDEESGSDDSEEEGMDVDVGSQALNGHANFQDEPMLVGDNDGEGLGPTSHKRRQPQPSSPPLPLSPISNPSSPNRKRARTSNWEPPEYIPDFLPPFPTVSDEMPVSTSDMPPTPHITQHTMPISAHVPEAVPEKQPITTLSQSLTSAAASDILVQAPYSQSSLSYVPEWHLPSLPSMSSSHTRQPPLPTPQVEPSLLSAYHYILTHPPPTELPPLNPSRHKVAMALIKQAQTNVRWNPADTLFASVGPCPPRVATIQPSYPVAIGDTPGSKEGTEKDLKLPATASRPVSASERIAPFISQQTSRIPELARHILPVCKPVIFPSWMDRSSRISFFSSLRSLLARAACQTRPSSTEEASHYFMEVASQHLGMPTRWLLAPTA